MEDFLALKELTIFQNFLDEPPRALNGTLSKLPVNLRKINMEKVWIHQRQSYTVPDSSWARLTHIEITVDGLYTVTCILHLCPDLSHLKIAGQAVQWSPNQTPVTHANLQSLCMYWRVLPDAHSRIFKVMTLPNLRMLEVSHTPELWPHEDFMEFLTQSKYPLERLVLDCAVSTTARQQEEYATLIPSFDIIAGVGRSNDVDEEWKD